MMKIIKSQLILIAGSIIFALCSCSSIKKGKPNIVFIIIDDLGWKDVGYMGSTWYETPNIDRLARQGMIFTNAYANAANCAPTRACLLSGQYSPRHGVFTVAKPDRGDSKNRRLIPIENSRKISPDKITIAEALKPAGYVSAAIGKWHVADPPQQRGFDVGLNKYEIGNGYEEGHFNKDSEYLTDRLTREAVEFITKNKDEPFFLYLAHYAVHTPIQAKEEMIAKYETKDTVGCHNHPTYAAMVESVDESVGRVMKKLEDLGVADNTVVIFMSDNGGLSTSEGHPTSNVPLRAGKGWLYEGGIREPMIIKWPGAAKPGSVCSEPVTSTDFYPTMLEMAGLPLKPKQHIDGVSLVPLLKGKKTLNREAIFWHYPHYGNQGGSPGGAVRAGDYKLIEFYEDNRVELYDLKKDISEKNNLAGKMPGKAAGLRRILQAWRKDVNAQMPTPNPDYAPAKDT